MTRREAKHLLQVVRMLAKREPVYRRLAGDLNLKEIARMLRQYLRRKGSCQLEDWEVESVLEYAREHCPDYALYQLVKECRPDA